MHCYRASFYSAVVERFAFGLKNQRFEAWISRIVYDLYNGAHRDYIGKAPRTFHNILSLRIFETGSILLGRLNMEKNKRQKQQTFSLTIMLSF